MTLSKDEMGADHPDLNALAAFVDGRLSAADRATMVAHLGGCAECRAILATYARAPKPPARFRHAAWIPIAATLALATAAGLMVWRTSLPGTPEPVRPSTPAPEPIAPPKEIPVPAPGRSPAAGRPPVTPDPLSTRRSAVRAVNGKTFRLVAGEWVDSAYDPVALLPVRDVVGLDDRRSLLERTPSLAPYAALGPKVTVAHEGIVYRFRP